MTLFIPPVIHGLGPTVMTDRTHFIITHTQLTDLATAKEAVAAPPAAANLFACFFFMSDFYLFIAIVKLNDGV